MSVKDLATKNTKDTKKVWPTVRLGDVCKVLTDGDWIESKDQSETGIRLIQTGNIGNGVFERKDNRARYISDATFSKLNCTEIYSGDVLISRLPEPVGRACIVEDMGCRMITAVDCSIVRFTNEVDSRFFIQYSQSSDYQAQVSAQLTGTTRARISRKHLSSVLIPCPPLSVQREIVARLEKELGEADKLAAKFKCVAELADDAFKAELDETFKTLEDNSRRDAETRRVRLGDVCEIKNGYTPKKDGLSEEGDIPYFRISSMNFPENLKMLDIPNAWLRGHWRSFKKGSIVFPKNGGAAYTGKVRVLSQDSVVDLNTGVCTPNSDCAKDYLYFWFTQIDIKRAIVEGTIPFVDFGKLADFLIPLPHLAAQRAIAAKLDAAKERCEKLKAVAMRGLAAAENLRKAILAEAFEQ